MMKTARAMLVIAATVASMAAGAGLASANTNEADLGPYFPALNDPHGVWCVQRMLNVMDHAGLVEDANYGPATTAAVKQFQKTHHYSYHLAADGIVGKKTGTEMLDQWKYVFHQAGGWGGYCGDKLPTTH